jgi:hypothetical protein
MALGSSSAFRPSGTVSITAGTTTSAVALNGGGESVLVTNATSSLAFVRFGADASVIASTSDMPIQPAARVMLAVNPFITYAAILLMTGTGTVFLTRGDGSFV